ncbi:hypothetical protein Y032_0084g1773 [Ancylostoma ceylanicum]|nr:hypothetical protein Y032_0084g1773 [Ancylostoma ceylanicum]
MAEKKCGTDRCLNNEYSQCIDLNDRHQVNEIINRLTKDVIEPTERELVQRRVLNAISNIKIALVVIDFQNDFISGSLSVKKGSAGEDPVDAIPAINSLVMEKELDAVVYTQDWHPANHISFVERARDPDRKIRDDKQNVPLKAFDTVQFDKPPVTQTLYPAHCVENSWGAELHAGLVLSRTGTLIVKKGQHTYVDSYSAFRDNNRKQLNGLDKLLKSRQITVFLGCGLAYDICVRHTVRDANDYGYLTGVVRDCSKGFSQKMVEDTNRVFASENIAILDAQAARDIINKKKVPLEWLVKLVGPNIRIKT